MKVGDLVRSKRGNALTGVVLFIRDCGNFSNVVRILTLRGTTTTKLIEDLEVISESR